MRDLGSIDPRLWLTGGLAALAVPPAVVGVTALGVPRLVAGSVGAAVAALVVWRTWARVPEGFAAPLRGRPWWLALWLVLALAAGVQTVRLSVFMHDAERADLSVLPERPFFRSHACLSAYTEASRIALDGVNVYEPKAYENRKLGRLDVDLFQYPPAFLVMGGVLRLGSEDFNVNRAVWFLVQALALLAAAFAVSLWIGGPEGARVAWAIPAVWLATPTLLAMQLGNFQLSAFTWSIASMLFAQSGWLIPAGALLGFTSAGKIFPAVLGLYLFARGHYRPVLWTAAWALAWLLLAIAWFGMKPQWDFLLFQVPRINSGAAFPWIDDPDAAGINYSVYGLVLRLRALGVPGMTREFGNALASFYGGCVLATAVYLGWRRRAVELRDDSARMQEAALWLAVMNLGSFRSPFVPDAYGLFGSIWLLTLVWAGFRRPGLVTTVAAGVLLVALSRVYDGILTSGQATPTWMILATLATQLAAMSLNAWMVWRSLPSPRLRLRPVQHGVAPAEA
jgi:hypothetical protein